MSSGDIVLLWFPFSNTQLNNFKKRPVLVLSKSGSGDDQVVACVMITGSADRVENLRAGDIAIPDWQSFGLAKESVVRPGRFWSAEERDVVRTIGKATPEFTAIVRDAVAKSIGLRGPT